MSAALFATIWVALALFVVGEAGKRHLGAGRATSSWAWRAWTLGAVLCALHMTIALGVRHGWSHTAAAAEIARRTGEVYGWAWGGGLYVNYLFAARWLAEACAWRLAPQTHARRPRGLVWLLRGFDLVVFVNAAIVFASPAGRIAGVPLVAALLWTWRPFRREPAALASS